MTPRRPAAKRRVVVELTEPQAVFLRDLLYFTYPSSHAWMEDHCRPVQLHDRCATAIERALRAAKEQP